MIFRLESVPAPHAPCAQPPWPLHHSRARPTLGRLGGLPGARCTDRRRAVGPAPAQVTGMSGQGGADQSRFMQARARVARKGGCGPLASCRAAAPRVVAHGPQCRRGAVSRGDSPSAAAPARHRPAAAALRHCRRVRLAALVMRPSFAALNGWPGFCALPSVSFASRSPLPRVVFSRRAAPGRLPPSSPTNAPHWTRSSSV
jgi:hypothetical protein